jgi:cytoskeletal protein CcmA (bactofilin family)
MQDSQNDQGNAPRTTLVEEGTAFKGEFASDCPIIVKGKIEGNITGPSLKVSATGAVAGVVKVGVIESEGELAGQFEADVVKLSGRVRDNTVIRAKSLEVKLAPEQGMMQLVFGECALEVGDMPSKEAALSEAEARAGGAPAAAQSPAAEAPSAPAAEAPASAAAPQEAQAQAQEAPAAEASAPAAEAAADDKAERKNGMKGKGSRPRTSTMPPPPA